MYIHLHIKTVRKGRKAAQAYFREYHETKPVGQLVKSTASVMQEYTQSGGVRPFGVSLLVAGMDGDGVPRLFQVDPSGAYFGWKATAIGKVCLFIHLTCSFAQLVYLVHILAHFRLHLIQPPVARRLLNHPNRDMSMPKTFWKRGTKMIWNWKMPFILLS